MIIFCLHLYLWNESHEDEHTDTRYDVRMVLDDKFMAEERRGVLVVRSAQHPPQSLVLGTQKAKRSN